MDETKKIELSNRLFGILAVLLLCISVLLVMQVYFKFKNLPENTPREITVSADGKAFVVPDIIVVQLGVTTEGMKVQDIVKENAEKMNNVIKGVKNLGVEEKDIQTTNYNLTPRYEWTQDGKRIFKGYTLDQKVRVKIRDLEKVGQILEKTTQVGANLVGDLQFTIDDQDKIRETARNDAIEKAKAKASQLANQSGLKLGKLVNIYEDYYSQPDFYTGTLKEAAAGAVSAIPDIQPGQSEVSVRVYLVYRIR